MSLPAIYIASKTKHAARWRALRAHGAPIAASWIDVTGGPEAIDYDTLWTRCASEAASASTLIVYVEPGEVLKGALVEVGIALGAGVPVLWCGPTDRHTVTQHQGVQVIADAAPASRLEVALAMASAPSSPASVARAVIRRIVAALPAGDALKLARLLALGTEATIAARCDGYRETQARGEPRPWGATSQAQWLDSLALQFWRELGKGARS